MGQHQLYFMDKVCDITYSILTRYGTTLTR